MFSCVSIEIGSIEIGSIKYLLKLTIFFLQCALRTQDGYARR